MIVINDFAVCLDGHFALVIPISAIEDDLRNAGSRNAEDASRLHNRNASSLWDHKEMDSLILTCESWKILRTQFDHQAVNVPV